MANFDQSAYTTMVNALYTIASNNAAVLPVEFRNQIVGFHDLRNGQQAQAYALRLFDYVSNAAMRLGGNGYLTDQQLFDTVYAYMSELYGQWTNQSRMAPQQPQGMYGQPSSYIASPASTGSFHNAGTPQGMFNQPSQQPQGYAGNFNSPNPPTPQAAPQIIPQPAVVAAQSQAPAMLNLLPNPMDSVTESLQDFNKVAQDKTGDEWGGERAHDKTIEIVSGYDRNSTTTRLSIRQCTAIHRIVQDDPMDVVKDFFRVVPESFLAKSFAIKIQYHHLETVALPTEATLGLLTFLKKTSGEMPIYEAIAKSVENLSVGSYRAFSTYLVGHINRALHLCCRSFLEPSVYIKIGELNDIVDLLSSSFQHKFKLLPDGRNMMKFIIENAIVSALSGGSSILFSDLTNLPMSTIRSSNAFAFSLDGVYEDRTNLEMSAELKSNLTTHELKYKTYILSKRAVVITNVLGKNVIPNLTHTPTPIVDLGAVILDEMLAVGDRAQYNNSFVVEKAMEATPITNDADVKRSYMDKDRLFVDQTGFAIQYGGKPSDFITSIDRFTTLDKADSPILGKHHIPQIILR